MFKKEGSEPEEESRDLRRNWAIIIPLLFTLYIIGYIDRGNISFAFSGIESELGLTTNILGIASGLFFIGYVAFQIPSIFINNKKGARIIMSLLPVLWSIFSIGNAFIHNSLELYLMQFLVGLSEGGFFPLAIVFIAQHFPERFRARANSLFMIAVPLSVISSSPLSMFIISQVGWRGMFILEGLPGLFLAPVTYSLLSTTSKKKITRERGDETNSIQEKQSRIGSLQILAAVTRMPVVWVLSSLWFLWLTCLFAVMNWIPYILETTTGKGITLLGFIISGIWAISPLVLVGVGHSSDRRGKRTIYVEVQLVVSLIGAIILFSFNRIFILTIAGFVLMATGLIGGIGIFWLLPFLYVPKSYNSMAVAFVNTIGNLGGFVGPYLFGYLNFVSGSFQSGYYILALLLIVTIFIAFSLKFFKMPELVNSLGKENRSDN